MLVCIGRICDARRPWTPLLTHHLSLGEPAGAEATCHDLEPIASAGSGGSRRGGADDLVSRVVVFGTLILIASGVLGAVVALGLQDDAPSPRAATSTQTTPTATTTTPTATTTTESEDTTAPPTDAEAEADAAPPTDAEAEADATLPPDLEAPEDFIAPAPARDDCDDGIDNDGDDLLDAAQDDGCLRDRSEAPANNPSDTPR